MATRHIALSQETYFVHLQEEVTFSNNDNFGDPTPFFPNQISEEMLPRWLFTEISFSSASSYLSLAAITEINTMINFHKKTGLEGQVVGLGFCTHLAGQ